MKTFKEINSLVQYLNSKRLEGNSIGLVPTMGALHQGHLALVTASVNDNDLTVCSIFVNPTQFNNPDDLEKYPRNPEEDLRVLKHSGCDVVFFPEVSEMYPKNRIVNLGFGYLEDTMEGKFRPGHFKGVGLVVAKFFNIVKPHRAYFGKKDLQQLAVIKKMNEELNFGIELHGIDTIRESSGLAMSSRNARLSESEKTEALIFYRSLVKAQKLLLAGHNIAGTKAVIADDFAKQANSELEYFEVVDTHTLLDISNISESNDVSLCIAGYVGKVRLIDNISLF